MRIMMKTAGEFAAMLKKITIRTLVENGGWDAKIWDVHACSNDMVFLYVFDHPTKFVSLFAIDRKNLQLAAEFGAEMSRSDANDVRGSVIYAIEQLATDKVSGAEKQDMERSLGVGLLLYAGTMQTYRLSGNMDNYSHFLVMVYRLAGSLDGFLRPAAFPHSGNTPISTDEFTDIVKRVIDTDQSNHPEWFLQQLG